MSQKYRSVYKCDPCPNGSTMWTSGAPWHVCAKITNCPVDGLDNRYTVYLGDADSFFTIRANTRINGRYVKGYVTREDNGYVFSPCKA